MKFVWNDRNIAHIGEHGISWRQAQYVVENVKAPYPQSVGDDKRLVIGKLPDGHFAQVIYVPSRAVAGAVFVLHARRLTDSEKRRFRRRTR